ncbi:PREDICTED: calcium-activated chloride channel regulator 4 [Calidris pugnax]|uniref:calcium-activated chloride channel regulator 4 n=1 Tax=Calidris pugnax TaxID=198806 RepID=UPI00071CA94D|nr:PREDICTED: calcium-activated chloride channel regulator 4 [Calidris pugnax]
MGVTRCLIFLLSFQLLNVAKGSMVWLNENGYEDLVVAIDPQVPEDANIILNTMNMIKNASNYLFGMTEHRFYFKSVKIIIPKTWKKDTKYSRLKTESYDKADVIIADHYMKHVDDPYTLRYGGCKEKGQYIHFTPNFLLNDSLTKVYGEKGRVFVHEWAHLRWGVFDEYNNDVPFYVSKNSKNASVEATSCPASVTGRPIFQECSGDKCETRDCRYDGQLYEKGCEFIADIQQNVSCSVMWMQSIRPVVEFCDENTHNIEAPNMQNKICNYKSTWEVIMESDDFRNSAVLNAPAPPSETTFTLLQTQGTAFALVLDVSRSMLVHNRIRHLYSAAEDFLLSYIEITSWVAIVTFSSNASEKAPLQQITNDAARQKLVQYLPTSAEGTTNICAGIRKGLELIADKMTTTYGSGILLLTDGEDSHMADCLDLVKQSGAKIHTIALGPEAAKELEEFSKLTGGFMLFAPDGATPSKLSMVFSAITSRSGDISKQSIQIENKELVVQHSGWMNVTVPVDRTVGNNTFFSISWSQSQPFFFLRDPKGREYGSLDFTINNLNQATSRLSINGTAEVGDWQFCIKNVHTASQSISVTAASRPASSGVPPVRAAVLVSRANSTFNAVVIYAEVSQGFLPVLGATVIATIEKDGAAAATLELRDNGAGADTIKNDGIYSSYFTTLQGAGRYSVKVNARGSKRARFGLRQNRALYLPGYREHGKIYMNAPRPEITDKEIRAKLGSFSRISVSSLVVKTTEDSAPIYPPCKITDLRARIENKTIVLSWTAPGGDLDNGKADHYIIKSSENLLDLRNRFDSATSVDCSNLLPKEAGREESFKIEPEHSVIQNGTIIYFAIRAVDDINLISEVSNIAQATWFIPPKASVPLNYDSNTDSANSTVTVVPLNYDGNNDSTNSTVTAAIVALSVAVVCTIVSSTLYVSRKKRGSEDVPGSVYIRQYSAVKGYFFFLDVPEDQAAAIGSGEAGRDAPPQPSALERADNGQRSLRRGACRDPGGPAAPSRRREEGWGRGRGGHRRRSTGRSGLCR